MRLTEIAHDENPGRSKLIEKAEAKYAAACRMIEAGDFEGAFEVADKLSQQTLPPDLAHATRIMSDILEPANSPSETAKKIFQFLPGKIFRVYDDEQGWNDDAMRELADAQRDLS